MDFDELPAEEQEGLLKYAMAALIPGMMSLGFPKLGIISLLTRLLLPSKLHVWFMWTIGILGVASLAAVALTLLFQCDPQQALWDLSLPQHCLDIKVLVGMSYGASCAWQETPHTIAGTLR